MTTYNLLQISAKNFLYIADDLNEQVSAYLNGSNDKANIDGYNKVKEAYRRFVTKYNEYYDERHDDGLDYVLAESVLD